MVLFFFREFSNLYFGKEWLIMDQHLVLYWLIATKQYLEAEQHNKQSRLLTSVTLAAQL
jgi:hypothetical protein